MLRFEDRRFETFSCRYEISNEDGIPILYYTPKAAYDFEKLKKYRQ